MHGAKVKITQITGKNINKITFCFAEVGPGLSGSRAYEPTSQNLYADTWQLQTSHGMRVCIHERCAGLPVQIVRPETQRRLTL